jgi:hypothetical protein
MDSLAWHVDLLCDTTDDCVEDWLHPCVDAQQDILYTTSMPNDKWSWPVR